MLPIFLSVLFGLIDLGVAIGVKQVVTHAAAEGARAAIGAQIVPSQDNNGAGNTFQSDPQSNAWDRAAFAQATSSSSSVGGSVVTGSPHVDWCTNDLTQKCITVQVTATSPVNIPVFGWLINPVQTSTAQVQVK